MVRFGIDAEFVDFSPAHKTPLSGFRFFFRLASFGPASQNGAVIIGTAAQQPPLREHCAVLIEGEKI